MSATLPTHDDLLSCCASAVWAQNLRAAGPYPDHAALLAAAERALRDLPWSEIEQAMAAHPRIGERADGQSREAAWSRREQSSMGDAADDVRAALVRGNHEYEERFGHVFLIFATGRSPQEMLGELNRRLGNDPLTEQGEVREALTRIALLRLERLLSA